MVASKEEETTDRGKGEVCVSVSLSLFVILSSLTFSLRIGLFLSRPTNAANGITRIPHFKRRFIHPTSSPQAGTN